MGRVAKKYPSGRYILRTPAKVDEGELYPIYLYYFCGGKQLRQSTSIMTMIKDWNQNANFGIGELRASYGPNYRKKNQALQKLLKTIDGYIFDYVERHGDITPDVIKRFMDGDYTPLRADFGLSFTNYAFNLLNNEYEKKKIRISTFKSSISIINRFNEYLNVRECKNSSDLLIGDISEELVRSFLNWSQSRKLKYNYVKKYQETISKICKHAAEEGLLIKETAQSIADITVEVCLDENISETIKYLNKNEVSKLAHIDKKKISTRQQEYIQMFLLALLACGLRFSDIITLKWSDINLDKREINKIIMKTRRSLKIPLCDDAVKILEQWIGRHKVYVFGLLPDDFNNNEETLRIRRNSVTATVNKSLERISEIAGLEKKVTTHYARHTFAVTSLEQGMKTSMISKLMGHRTSYITENIYADYLPDSKKEAVNKLKFDL